MQPRHPQRCRRRGLLISTHKVICGQHKKGLATSSDTVEMLGARRTLATHVPDDGRPERARRTRPRALVTHVLLAAIAVIPVGAKNVDSTTSQRAAPAPPLSFEREMIAGAVARAAAQCCMYPADVMKTLAQVAPFPPPVPGCRAPHVPCCAVLDRRLCPTYF